MTALVEEVIAVLVLATKSEVPCVVRLVGLKVVCRPTCRRVTTGDEVAGDTGDSDEGNRGGGEELEHYCLLVVKKEPWVCWERLKA